MNKSYDNWDLVAVAILGIGLIVAATCSNSFHSDEP